MADENESNNQRRSDVLERREDQLKAIRQRELEPDEPVSAAEVTHRDSAIASQSQAAQPTEWQPIEGAPKDGRTLLLGCFNTHGKWRTMRGQWFSQATIAEEWEDPDDAEEGWYETAVEPDVPNCWGITPTHWMPLPAAPGSHIAGTSQATNAQAEPEALRSCSEAETSAFEAWARDRKYDMTTHPLHWLFLNERTYAARQGWIAALRFAREHLAAPVAKEAPVVPKDWQLVPKKLTPKMADVLEFGRTQPSHNTYLNLLGVAPKAPIAKEVREQAESGRFVDVELVKSLCRDLSSRAGSVYIKDVEGALDGLVASVAKEAEKEQQTFAQRLYGPTPSNAERRDALHTMALIFAASETDSARDANFEDMWREFLAVPRIAIFDSLTRHTGLEISTNYTFETEEFFEVEAVERVLGASVAKESTKEAETGVQAALRKLCDQIDNEKRRLRPTPGTGQNHSYLLAEDVDAYVEEARKSIAPTTQQAAKAESDQPKYTIAESHAHGATMYELGYQKGRASVAKEAPTVPEAVIAKWMSLRGNVVTCAINGTAVYFPPEDANDVLDVFDAALPDRSDDEDGEPAAQKVTQQAAPEAPTYQIREIGEGDWESVSKERMESVRNDARWDYRIVEPAATQQAAKAESEQAHVMPPFEAPAGQHGDGLYSVELSDADKSALLSIVGELEWSVNGTWVITKSGEQIHVLDALAFARTTRAFIDRTPTTSTVSAPLEMPYYGYTLPLQRKTDEKNDVVRICDSSGAAIFDLNTHTSRSLDDLDGLAEERKGAEDFADFIIRMVNKGAAIGTEGAQAAPEDVRNQALEEAIVEVAMCTQHDTDPLVIAALSVAAKKIRALKRTSTNQANADTGSAE